MKQLVLEALAALDELEHAIERADLRKIGAALYLLRRSLQQLMNEAQP